MNSEPPEEQRKMVTALPRQMISEYFGRGYGNNLSLCIEVPSGFRAIDRQHHQQ